MCNSSKSEKHKARGWFSLSLSVTSLLTLQYKDSAVSSTLATTTPECGIKIYASIQDTACDVRRRKAVLLQRRDLLKEIDQRSSY